MHVLYTGDSCSSGVVLSYVDEANISHVLSPVSFSSNADNSQHHHHQQQQQQPMPGLDQPPATIHSPLPIDLPARYAASISPPPYWPVTSPAVVMTSRDDVAAPGDYNTSYQQQQQQQQQLRHADVTTSPIYAEKIVSELIETERTYVDELRQIVQVTRHHAI